MLFPSRLRVLVSNVAIIHSGGDSRRSPLQSISGKAWSSLNCAWSSNKQEGQREGEREDNEGDSGEVSLYSSPLTVLLSELSDLIARLPPPSPSVGPCCGSVVVASSDVLVSLEIPKVSWKKEEAGGRCAMLEYVPVLSLPIIP